MIRITVLIFAFFIFKLNTFCQLKIVSESNKFPEPSGKSFLVQMKNDNTIFINVSGKDGIAVRVYDQAHIEKATANFFPGSVLKSPQVRAVFEVNNDVLLFISALEGKIAILDRFIIDGNTGKLKEENQIISAQGKGGTMDLGVNSTFIVKRSIVDESYGIAVINEYQNDKNKRIQIIQFNQRNEEIHSIALVPEDNDEFKFFVLMDVLVIDSNRTNVILYNGKKKYFFDEKKGRLLMASVDRNNSKIAFTNINLPEGIKFAKAITTYNPALKKIFMIVSEPRHDDDPVAQYFVKIDMGTNKVETSPFPSISDELNKKFRDKYSVKTNYIGTLKQFQSNEDQTCTAVYEEYYNYNYNGNSTSYTGKILVTNYSNSGEVISSYIIPKLFMVESYSEYKEYLLVNTEKNKYLCINDTKRNNDVQNDKFIPIVGVAELDAFSYLLAGPQIFPTRNNIFTDQDKSHELIAFKVSDYSKPKNVLVVLKLTKTASNAETSLVWFKPQ